jgi:hypothetical protein
MVQIWHRCTHAELEHKAFKRSQMMPEGWIIPENRALARRPQILGLPLGYAALLIMAVLFLGLTLHYIGAAIYLLMFGWSLGKLVTYYDPFAWELLARGLYLPRLMWP